MREVQLESLKDEVNHSEQEARMVLPGIQALFGFQKVEVKRLFNKGHAVKALLESMKRYQNDPIAA